MFHLAVIHLTASIFLRHHFSVLRSFPTGTPRDMAHSSSCTHLIERMYSCCVLEPVMNLESPLYDPIGNPIRFPIFSFIPVAAHHLCTPLNAGRSWFVFLSRRVVSSANWLMKVITSPMVMPLTPSISIATRSACATIRKSRGDTGQPCATPDLMPNQSL